jgi:hypothetical protein
MPKILVGGHAELLGTTMVEPGHEIPNDADTDIVKRLQDEGRIVNVKPSQLKDEGGQDA